MSTPLWKVVPYAGLYSFARPPMARPEVDRWKCCQHSSNNSRRWLKSFTASVCLCVARVRLRQNNQSYLVVGDVVEKVDKQNDLLFVAAKILAVLPGRHAEQTHEVRRRRSRHRCCCRWRSDLFPVPGELFSSSRYIGKAINARASRCAAAETARRQLLQPEPIAQRDDATPRNGRGLNFTGDK